MIIRSACAGAIDGIILAEKGCAKLDSLVIKASAGTVFKAPILRCEQLHEGLDLCKQHGGTVVGLSSHGQQPLSAFEESQLVIYVLGNETDGVSRDVEAQCDDIVSIPMNNGVESLNVAVTASLIAFRNHL